MRTRALSAVVAVGLLSAACTPGVDGRGAIGATIRTSTPSALPSGAALLPDPTAGATDLVPLPGTLLLETLGTGSTTLDLRGRVVPGRYLTMSLSCADGPFRLSAVGSGPAARISDGGCANVAGTFVSVPARARDQRIQVTVQAGRVWRVAIWQRRA